MSPQIGLQRFFDAQGPIFEQVLLELRQAKKQSHWIWYVFPQIAGLGQSSMSHKYAIGSLDEARAYLAHPVLGTRLRQCIDLLLEARGKSAYQILESPDDMKLHSSLTLFALAHPEEKLFSIALSRFFRGLEDQSTVAILKEHKASVDSGVSSK